MTDETTNIPSLPYPITPQIVEKFKEWILGLQTFEDYVSVLIQIAEAETELHRFLGMVASQYIKVYGRESLVELAKATGRWNTEALGQHARVYNNYAEGDWEKYPNLFYSHYYIASSMDEGLRTELLNWASDNNASVIRTKQKKEELIWKSNKIGYAPYNLYDVLSRIHNKSGNALSKYVSEGEVMDTPEAAKRLDDTLWDIRTIIKQWDEDKETKKKGEILASEKGSGGGEQESKDT